MNLIVLISNGDTIHEHFDSENTVSEVADSFIQKYVPHAKSIRFLYNSRFLKPEQKLSEIGYDEGKVIFAYPNPPIKPTEKSKQDNKPIEQPKPATKSSEQPKQETRQNIAQKQETKSTERPKQEIKQNTPQKQEAKQVEPQKQENKPKQSQRPEQAQFSQRPTIVKGKELNMKTNPKYDQLRELILENPPYSFDAVIDSIAADDIVLADKIKKNPSPFLALMGISCTKENGKLTFRKY